MIVAVYDAWLHTLGGGEKHALTAALALAQGHEVHVHCHYPVDRQTIERAMGFELNNMKISTSPLLPDSDLCHFFSRYDLFINATHDSMLPNPCRHGLRLLFFPPPPPKLPLRALTHLVNWWAGRAGLPSYGPGFYGPERVGRGWYRATGAEATIVMAHNASRLWFMAGNPGDKPRPLSISHGGVRLAELDIPPTRGRFVPVGPVELSADWLSDRTVTLHVGTEPPDPESAPLEARSIGLLIADPKSRKLAELPLRLLTRRIFPKLGEAVERQNSHGGRGALASYDCILANSRYTAAWLRSWWGLPSRILFPPVETIPYSYAQSSKSPEILSIGRFFIGGHNKKHEIMIQVFGQMVGEGLRGWTLRLMGATGKRVEDRRYVEILRSLAAGLPVVIETDVASGTLNDAVRRASIYWHAAGHGEDRSRNPGAFEHFGVAAVEAMGAGAVPVVFDGGGLTETVEHGVSGFLWRSRRELRAATWQLIRDARLRGRMATAATERANLFDAARFRRELLEIVDSLA